AGIKQNLRENIHLGLDLKGGSHLVMRVKTEEHLKRLTEDNAVAALNAAKAKGLPVSEGHAEVGTNNYRVVLTADDASKINEVREAIENERNVELSDRLGWSFSSSGNKLIWNLTGAAQRTLSDEATKQALQTIETRINALGVAEPTLQTHGAQDSHQILLQMPGVTDPERVKKVLRADSRLELVHVISPPSPAPSQTYSTREEAIASLNSSGTIPANRKVLEYSERMDPSSESKENQNQPKAVKWVVVETPAIIDGSELRNAAGVPSRAGGTEDYEIQFSLKKSGAD